MKTIDLMLRGVFFWCSLSYMGIIRISSYVSVFLHGLDYGTLLMNHTSGIFKTFLFIESIL